MSIYRLADKIINLVILGRHITQNIQKRNAVVSCGLTQANRIPGNTEIAALDNNSQRRVAKYSSQLSSRNSSHSKTVALRIISMSDTEIYWCSGSWA